MFIACRTFLLVSVALSVDCFSARVEPLIVPPEGKIGFTRLSSSETGILFTNHLSEHRSSTNRNLLGGSGVAAGDIDGDGNIDLFFCGLDNANVLYRNLGNWRFQDVTASNPAVACVDWDCTGATFADVDGDADLDLLVNALGRGTHLFLNSGKGQFTLKTDSGLHVNTGSTSMALADIDGDSDLDLYVANFRPTTVRDHPTVRFSIEYQDKRPAVAKVDGRAATAPDLTNRFAVAPSGEVVEFGEADVLYENDGTGRFTHIPFTGGRFLDETGAPLLHAPLDWGLAVQFHDFTGDGAADLYICNDYWTPDRIWINDGRGTFRAAPLHAFRSTSRSSMGVDFADIDRDGDADFIVVDMLARTHRDRQMQVGELPIYSSLPGISDAPLQLSQNTVQLNRGDGTFAQIGEFCGLEGSEWSWAPVFLDVDLDGWEDLLVSNGHRRDFQNADATEEIQRALAARRLTFSARQEIMALFPTLPTPKGAFRNNRDLTFTESASEWGLGSSDISHGFCLADLDNDGDLDLLMNNLGTAAGIYRNDVTAPRISVRLIGTGKNTSGVGAKVTLRTGSFAQTQEMISGGRYLSGDHVERVFAIPRLGRTSVEIRWPDGQTTVVSPVRSNHRYFVPASTPEKP